VSNAYAQGQSQHVKKKKKNSLEKKPDNHQALSSLLSGNVTRNLANSNMLT